MNCEWADSNPYNPDWKDASHYKCVLNAGRKQMTTYFSMGLAHTKEPEVQDVLDCLASDSASVENKDNFESWASEFGYDIDSRKAERIYIACERQARKLKQFLGEDKYYELLWEVERI